MIKRLLAPLEPATQEELGPGDKRFETLADLVLDGQYKEAGARARALIDGGLNDVRVITYYLFSEFFEAGPASLPEIVEIIRLLLTESWEELSPTRKRERHALSSLTWLLMEIAERLRRVEAEGDPRWQSWLSATPPGTLDRTLLALPALHEALRSLEPSDEAPVHTSLFAIAAWLRDFSTLFAAEEPPEEAVSAPQTEPDEDDPPPEEAGGDLAPFEPHLQAPRPASPRSPPAPRARAAGGPMVEGSAKLASLLKKLAAFEALVARGDFERAAIIFDDVNMAIESFDPREYLPAVFATFYRDLQRCVDDVSQELGEKGSYRWMALEQLYRVDIDAFLAGDEGE